MIKSREVTRVDTPAMMQDESVLHRARPLVPPGQWAETDPFLLLMEDWYARGAFENHPHRGIETVTYMLDGSNAHYDNHDNQGVIGPGEALWLTAGRGLVHNEIPIDDRPVHTLQLWINLPRAAKLVEASFQELKGDRLPRRQLPGVEVIVFSGASGNVVAPTRNHAKVTMVEARLQPGSTFEQELPPGYNGFVLVLEGEGLIGHRATLVGEGQVAWLGLEEAETEVVFRSEDKSFRVILFAGQPLREPVVARGPFVMNTEEEIARAYLDFNRQREKFGLSGEDGSP